MAVCLLIKFKKRKEKDMQTQPWKIYYFPLNGRGDCARAMCCHSGAKWENCIIQFADWPTLKPDMPNNAMPVLELCDGTRIGQAACVNRYIARQCNYYPWDAMECAKMEFICECYKDIFDSLFAPI